MSKSSGQLLPQGMYVRASGTYAGSFKVDGRWVRRTIGQDREKAITAFHHFRKSGTAPRASRVTAEQAKQVTVTDVLDLFVGLCLLGGARFTCRLILLVGQCEPVTEAFAEKCRSEDVIPRVELTLALPQADAVVVLQAM